MRFLEWHSIGLRVNWFTFRWKIMGNNDRITYYLSYSGEFWRFNVSSRFGRWKERVNIVRILGRADQVDSKMFNETDEVEQWKTGNACWKSFFELLLFRSFVRFFLRSLLFCFVHSLNFVRSHLKCSFFFFGIPEHWKRNLNIIFVLLWNLLPEYDSYARCAYMMKIGRRIYFKYYLAICKLKYT